MGRPAPPSDDGSPARLIAAMVGIVGILLLGSLAWSAVGALVSAVGAAGSALSSANPAPPATLVPVAAVTPAAAVTVAATPIAVASPTAGVAAVTPTSAPTATGTPAPTGTAVASPTTVVAARNPWILLPQPEPGARIQPGSVALEARGRGDSPITAMRLELDGSPLPVALEQRSESTWRGSATAKVGAGQHTVRATVVDADGRTGSFRWTFTAAPGP